MTTKSPSGSLCPYYFMGGELHPLKYGSYFKDKAGLFAVIQAEEAFILQSGGVNNRRIWVDLYETTIDDEVAEVIVAHIKTIGPKINKICLVGCTFMGKLRLSKFLGAEKMRDQIRFFFDPEEAKRWLVRAF